jgi:translation initiation factor IF-1
MPKKQEFIEQEGVVEELLPSLSFRVKLNDGRKILAYLSGRMRMHKIRLLPGDKVRVEFSPYDLEKGRITYRF